MTKSDEFHTPVDEVPLKKVQDRSPSFEESTDLGRWRLKAERGRQTWHYLSTDKEVELWPQTYADKYYLGQSLVRKMLHESNRPRNVDCVG